MSQIPKPADERLNEHLRYDTAVYSREIKGAFVDPAKAAEAFRDLVEQYGPARARAHMEAHPDDARFGGLKHAPGAREAAERAAAHGSRAYEATLSLANRDRKPEIDLEQRPSYGQQARASIEPAPAADALPREAPGREAPPSQPLRDPDATIPNPGRTAPADRSLDELREAARAKGLDTTTADYAAHKEMARRFGADRFEFRPDGTVGRGLATNDDLRVMGERLGVPPQQAVQALGQHYEAALKRHVNNYTNVPSAYEPGSPVWKVDRQYPEDLERWAKETPASPSYGHAQPPPGRTPPADDVTLEDPAVRDTLDKMGRAAKAEEIAGNQTHWREEIFKARQVEAEIKTDFLDAIKRGHFNGAPPEQVLQAIKSEDQLAKYTRQQFENSFHNPERPIFRDPEAAMEQFKKLYAKDPEKAIRTLQDNPAALARGKGANPKGLETDRGTGMLGRFRSDDTGARTQAKIAAMDADSMTRAHKFRDRPVQWTDPRNNETITDRAQIRARLENFITERGTQLGNANQTLKEMGGVEMARREAGLAMDNLSEKQKEIVKKTDPKASTIYNKYLVAKDAVGKYLNAIDPPGA